MRTTTKKLISFAIIALLVLTTWSVGTESAAFALDEETVPEEEVVLPASDMNESDVTNGSGVINDSEETTGSENPDDPGTQPVEKPVLQTTIKAKSKYDKTYKETIKDTVTVTPAWGRTMELYRYDAYRAKWIRMKTFTTAKKEKATVTVTYPTVWKAYSESTWKIVCPKFETDDSVLAAKKQTVKISSKVITAKAAVVMDASSGEVMYAQNARGHLKVASLTKMVTMMVVCDKAKFSKKVKITKEAVQARKLSGGLGLRKGDKVRMKHLVHATLMASANDAAAAAACGVSGSQKKFAKLMKQKAQSLGATESTYDYAFGDWHSNTYSTAYDQALIGREFMTNSKYSELRSIVKKRTYTFRTLKKKRRYRVKMGGMSTSLIKNGCSIGIKSGYNKDAGYCYANAWKHDGKLYISIVLGTSSSKKLVAAQKELIKFGNYSADHKLMRIKVK